MAVRGNGTGENVVNHDSRDGSNQAHGRGQQGFGNTRCDNGQVSGLCLRNTDEAVHDAPDGPEQTNKRGDSTDGRENTVTTPHMTTGGADAAFQTEPGTVFNAAVIGRPGGEFKFILRIAQHLAADTIGVEAFSLFSGFVQRAYCLQRGELTAQATFATPHFGPLSNLQGPGDHRD